MASKKTPAKKKASAKKTPAKKEAAVREEVMKAAPKSVMSRSTLVW